MADTNKSNVLLGDSVDDSSIINTKNEINNYLKPDVGDSDRTVESVVGGIGGIGGNVSNILKFEMAKTDKSPAVSADSKNDGVIVDKTKATEALQSSLSTTPKKLHCVKNKEHSTNVTLKNTFASDFQEKINHDSDDGMMSEIEQARQFIADRKVLNTIHKTPIKQNNFNRKRSDDSPPVTPGKCKRAKLITLASPKTKKVNRDDGNSIFTDTKAF